MLVEVIAKLVVISVYIGVMVLILTPLSQLGIDKDNSETNRWCNVRLWALLVIVLQILVYIAFG